MKQCTVCKDFQSIDRFHKSKSTNDGLTYECKSCKSEASKKYRAKNRASLIEKSQQRYRENLSKYQQDNRDYYQAHRETLLEKAKQHYQDNREEKLIYAAEWFSTNKQSVAAWRREWYQTQKIENPILVLKNSLRSRLYKFLKTGAKSKTRCVEEMIGCTVAEFRVHLESQFVGNMRWENYGEWELDHIIPLAIAKNIDEVMKLNHYTNLQPLWAKDNRRKGAKLKESFNE